MKHERWQLEYDDIPSEGFPDGLRISTDCVTRRLIEPLDPARYYDFPEAIGKRGHGFERIMQEYLLKRFQIEASREIVVPWEYGETHLDLFIVDPSNAFDTDKPLMIELKSQKDAEIRTENIRQVQRQMYATERAVAKHQNIRRPYLDPVDNNWEWEIINPKLLQEAEWRIVIIDPVTWGIPNPQGVRVTISDERRSELDAEWEQMREFMGRKRDDMLYDIHWQENMPECICGKCFLPPIHELPTACHEHAAAYFYASEEAKYAAAAKALEKEQLVRLITRLKKDAPDTLERGSYIGGGWKVTVTKNGSLRVTPHTVMK